MATIETATLDQAAKILAYFRDEPRELVQALLASGLLADVRDANFNEPIDRDGVRKLLGLKPLRPLLEELGTVTVPATNEPFVVRDKFVRNTGDGAPVKISFLGSNFQEWFGGKTEEPRTETALRYGELTRFSLDRPILEELGEEVETTLSQIYWLMVRQPSGEEGTLLADVWANVFYIRAINNTLRAVCVGWDGDGWSLDARSVESRYRWGDGYRVFSRNS